MTIQFLKVVVCHSKSREIMISKNNRYINGIEVFPHSWGIFLLIKTLDFICVLYDYIFTKSHND